MHLIYPIILRNSLINKQSNHINPNIVFTHFVLPPLPYPETISAKVQMTDAHQGAITIPYKYVNTIARGMTANIEFEGYDAETYGVANGVITATSHIPLQTETGSVFTAQVSMLDCRYKIISGMTGTAFILVSNESIFQRVIQRITSII